MTDAADQRAAALFERVCELDADERRKVLDDACADDSALRSRVEDLLASYDAPAGQLTNLIGRAATDLQAGEMPDQIGPYSIRERLGSGGFEFNK